MTSSSPKLPTLQQLFDFCEKHNLTIRYKRGEVQVTFIRDHNYLHGFGDNLTEAIDFLEQDMMQIGLIKKGESLFE